MKVLLVTTVLNKGVVGPAVFSRLLADATQLNYDVLVENEVPADNVITLPIQQSYISRKLSLYSRIKPYYDKIATIADDYQCILYSSTVLAYRVPQTDAVPVVMINDDNYIKAQLGLSKYSWINRFYQGIERRIVNSAPMIIANSDYLAEQICQKYGCPKTKIRVLYKAVDLHKYSHQRTTTIDVTSPIKILFVKNDYKRGGLYDLMGALKLLPQYQFQLTIVGNSPKVPTVDNVVYDVKGGLQHSEVLTLMQSLDIFCVPSRREALGVANMEAMASGIPVVTTDAGGIPEVITEKEGWICKPSNPSSLADTLQRCIERPKERQQKVELAAVRVQSFSKENMIARLKEILQEAVSLHG